MGGVYQFQRIYPYGDAELTFTVESDEIVPDGTSATKAWPIELGDNNLKNTNNNFIWYKFEAETAGTYTFTCTNTSGNADIYLKDENGKTQLAYASGTLSYIIMTPGIYTLHIGYAANGKLNISRGNLPGPVEEFPWTENFNSISSGIPQMWDNSEGTTGTDSYKWNYWDEGKTGSCVRFDSYMNSSGNTNYLITREIALPSDFNATLSFYFKNPTGGDFSVYVREVETSQETVLFTGLTGQYSWIEKTKDLSSFKGKNIKILFKGTSNWGSGNAYIYLDDISISVVDPNAPDGTEEKPYPLNMGSNNLIGYSNYKFVAENVGTYSITIGGDFSGSIDYTVKDANGNTVGTGSNGSAVNVYIFRSIPVQFSGATVSSLRG